MFDSFFTKYGIWSFNDSYILGYKVCLLPVEEWMFFIFVPFACLFIYENTNCNKYYVSFAITSANTVLHAWNCGYNWSKGYPQFLANLVNQPIKANYIMGNNQYTIGESGSNSKASIAVGSYNSNVNWTNFWGGTKSIDPISQKDTITGF